MNGESFYGRAFIVNAWYLTAYEPIIDSNTNEIIGILYVGVKEDIFQEKLKENMARQVIGKSGYIFILDEQGNYVLSKGRESDGDNIWEAEDEKGNKIIQEIVTNAKNLKAGETKTIYYPWKNKGELTARDSLVAYAYYPEWGLLQHLLIQMNSSLN
ncbi:MAG: Cache 3/Cache 2 fusion domain-containing protein [ANME-2 cluster archaeon]|nr:Cache 3/Cache 2 fusion domain-containing protein [ANME-2 cluster archaeon]